MAKINGRENNSVDGLSVLDVVGRYGYNLDVIAVEFNEDILPKADYENTILTKNDKLEIVSFVGGG